MPTFSNATCRNEESLLHEVQYCNYRGEEDELRGVHGPIAAPSNSPGQAPHCSPPSPLWQFMTDREGLFTPRVQATYTLSRGIRNIFFTRPCSHTIAYRRTNHVQVSVVRSAPMPQDVQFLESLHLVMWEHLHCLCKTQKYRSLSR